MKTLELNISDEVYQKLEEMASQDREPINAFALRKLEEMARAFAGYQELERRAVRGHHEGFQPPMAKVPITPPLHGDAR